MSPSSVSVIVPCYRYGHYLRQCVESVLAQAVPVRVLVIDDASDDGSAAVAHELAEAHPNVEVLVHEDNLGHIGTYNEGLDWADGTYLCLLSADDRLAPGALVRAAEVMDAFPRVGFVFGPVKRFTKDEDLPTSEGPDGKSRRSRPTQPVIHPGPKWLSRRFEDGTSCIASPEVVVRTEAQRALGYYNPNLPHSGDLEMWLRYALHYDVAYLRGAPQAYYRVHGENMSTQYYAGGVGDLQERWEAFESVLGKIHDSRMPILETNARRALAREALRRARRGYERARVSPERVDELIAFAQATYPDYPSLPAWRSFQRRQLMGHTWSRRLWPVLPAPYADRIRQLWWWHSIERRGT